MASPGYRTFGSLGGPDVQTSGEPRPQHPGKTDRVSFRWVGERDRDGGSVTVHLVDIDHVGISVEDLEDSVERYRAMLGVEPVHRERVEDQGVDEVLFAVGSSFIQLLGAIGPDSPVGRSLATRGPGLHHVAYRVRDIAAALEELSAQGARLVDRAPRQGSRDTLIAFVHPRSMGGVLVELVQTR
ncbi:MAG: methylmalonyl-CoA epimerase [Actinobacteria bacterium]|nr:MAG: methylmalonyl-CoA epimerase [Actinomycetota bacterium]